MIAHPIVDPYYLKVHYLDEDARPRQYAVEMRPRASTWGDPIAAIPTSERERLNPVLAYGPAGRLPRDGAVIEGSELSPDGELWVMGVSIEATPTYSCYLYLDDLPSKLIFGSSAGGPHYIATHEDGLHP